MTPGKNHDGRHTSPALGLIIVGLGASLAPLDIAVNVALPAITAHFGLALGDVQWLVICYVLVYGSLMLVCGKLGDLFGHRLMFQIGLAVSVAAFLLCAFAPGFGWLLVFRVVQGLGAALVLSCAPALATSLYDESARAWALGIYAGLFAVSWALGPLAGGALVDGWGWGAVFWCRAPIALLALALSWLLPAPRADTQRRFDAVGAGLMAFWMSALLLTLAVAQLPDSGVWAPAALGVAGLAALVAFVLHQRNHDEPILRLSLFRDIDFTLFNLMSVAVNLVGFAVLLLVPYHLTRIANLSATTGGVVLAVNALGMILGSSLAGRLAAVGQRRLLLAGVVLVAVGTAAVGETADGTMLTLMAVALFCQGTGLGLVQVAYTDIVTATLPLRDRGVAGSLAMVSRTLGTVTGATLLSALFQWTRQAALGDGLAADAAFVRGFEATFMIAAAFLAGVLLLSFLRRGLWRHRVPVTSGE
jgi:EmrB/QacA subfamily drug resistance transporter